MWIIYRWYIMVLRGRMVYGANGVRSPMVGVMHAHAAELSVGAHTARL